MMPLWQEVTVGWAMWMLVGWFVYLVNDPRGKHSPAYHVAVFGFRPIMLLGSLLFLLGYWFFGVEEE